MSCSNNNCVCDAVQNILDQQEAVEDQCPTSCYTNLLAPTVAPGRDTIPFILYTKKGKPFSAFGGIGGDSFRTPFFRVSNLDGCCATLELLEPDLNGGGVNDCTSDIEEIICRTEELERTGFCIEVDLDCFCAIQCLSPDLVESVLSGAGRHKRKHR
ncbi:CotY/CotZ family spore coat protein [Bacillus suaedaesalsae]|uniref:Spore coat protein n=1 Tax=Bacillus suaedaesalsae TaxID=2810349 RepID=A0ABS2DID0_9BACI|nr:CotY/CotZ family spore coat protein [Bacillus suaedaesalsae]MBM6618246.1 spore coat protein [Bacillus suaedaesalsae]